MMLDKQLIVSGAHTLTRMAVENLANAEGAQSIVITFKVYDDEKRPCQWDVSLTFPKKPGCFPKRPREKKAKGDS